jgi:hypothetical protein
MPSAAVVELAGEAEQLGQGTTGRCDGVARRDRRLRLDIDDETVEVGALTGTSRLDAVGHLEHGRVDRVDRDLAGFAELVAVLRRGDVAAATLDGELELELRLVVQRRDEQLGVVDLDTGRSRDVGSRHLAGALLAQVRGDRLIVLARDDELLDVQDDLGDILLDARDGAELVEHTVDADARDSSARDRRQEGATEGVSEGVAEAWFERLDHEA